MEMHSSAELMEEEDKGKISRFRRLIVWLWGLGRVFPTELDNLPAHRDQFHILLHPEQVRPANRNKLRLIMAVVFLFFGVSASTVMWLTDVYDEGILKLVSIRNDIDVVFNLWQHPPTRPFLYVYVFNYTNYREALDNKERPRVKEVGPFVFREQTQRVNIHFNDNDTVSFQEKKTITFMPDLSAGSLNQTVRIPDLYLISMLNYLKELYYLEQRSIYYVISGSNPELFQEMTVYEFIWGYRNQVFDAMKNFSRFFGQDLQPFGYLKKRAGVHSEVVTVYTGSSQLDEVGEIERVDGLDRIGAWGQSECDILRASDGALFPGRKTQAHTPLYVFSKDLCRRLPLRYYKDTQSADGFPVVEYRVPDDLFEYGVRTPDNACYKFNGQFPPNGVFLTSPCAKNVPIHVSFPHFWMGSDQLHEKVQGLEPDGNKHRSTFLIHNRLGVSLLVRTKFQMNIQYNKAHHINKFDGIENGTILPIAWMEYDSGPLPDYFVNILYHLTYTVRYVQRALNWLSLIALITSVIVFYKEFTKYFW